MTDRLTNSYGCSNCFTAQPCSNAVSRRPLSSCLYLVSSLRRLLQTQELKSMLWSAIYPAFVSIYFRQWFVLQSRLPWNTIWPRLASNSRSSCFSSLSATSIRVDCPCFMSQMSLNFWMLFEIFFLFMCMFPNDYSMCTQCPWRSIEGTWSSGTGITDLLLAAMWGTCVGSKSGPTGRAVSVLLTPELSFQTPDLIWFFGKYSWVYQSDMLFHTYHVIYNK